MKTDVLLEKAKDFLKDREAVGAMAIQRKFNVHFRDARRIVTCLQNTGLITDDWDSSIGGYRVIAGNLTPAALDAVKASENDVESPSLKD